MPSAQIRRLTEHHHYPLLDEANLDAYVAQRDHLVLFFSENPAKFPESNDVAMILPELVKAFAGRLEAALIAPAAQQALQRRYGFSQWPALVFLRRGAYLGAITQMRNWDDYLREIEQLLQAEPTSPPGFAIPVVGEASPSHHQE
jgi:hydrogenase-1 operon protein HyaE